MGIDICRAFLTSLFVLSVGCGSDTIDVLLSASFLEQAEAGVTSRVIVVKRRGGKSLRLVATKESVLSVFDSHTDESSDVCLTFDDDKGTQTTFVGVAPQTNERVVLSLYENSECSGTRLATKVVPLNVHSYTSDSDLVSDAGPVDTDASIGAGDVSPDEVADQGISDVSDASGDSEKDAQTDGGI